MSKQDSIPVNGTIIEANGDCRYTVELENGITIKAQLSGKLKQAFIKCIPGDQVIVEMSPYDLTHGRISRRITKGGSKPGPTKKRK